MQELNHILNKMTELLQQLSGILHTEQMILIENYLVHKLGNIIDEKNQLLIKLKILDEQRIAIGKELHLASPYSDNEPLANQWATIVKSTSLLAQMNRDNGEILHKRLDQTRQTIDFFNKSKKTNIYTNGGYQKTETVSTTRAKV